MNARSGVELDVVTLGTAREKGAKKSQTQRESLPRQPRIIGASHLLPLRIDHCVSTWYYLFIYLHILLMDN